MKTKYQTMYMKMAEACAEASEAIRNKVGCVVVTESGVVASGLNGTPPGWHTNECEYFIDRSERYYGSEVPDWNMELVTKPEVLHAERNALDKMLAEGVSSKNSTVFVTLSPCESCALALIGAKVKQVIYKDEYRCTKGLDMLRKANIIVEQFNKGE